MKRIDQPNRSLQSLTPLSFLTTQVEPARTISG